MAKTSYHNKFRFFTAARAAVAAFLMLPAVQTLAQGDVRASARMDARQITIGDQARVFIDVQATPSSGTVQWAQIPDTFNKLEIVERGKIDTLRQGNTVTYRQRLVVTGFDSGMYRVPSFVFTVVPQGGTPYTVSSDSLELLVNTVAVDTTQAFKPIKSIMAAQTTWRDYLLYILGGGVFVALIVLVIIYFLRNKKVAVPKPAGPQLSLQDHVLQLLAALDAKQLWQKGQVKQYYIDLTDIVRNYIEARFSTPALELTTDELLYKVQLHKELQPYYSLLRSVLYTADLAKFAKAEPTPMEHTDSMEKARQFVNSSRPVVITQPTTDNKI